MDVDREFRNLVEKYSKEHPLDVMLLEDDRGSADLLARRYEGSSIDIRWAQDPKVATILVSHQMPDVVIADLMLGALDESGEDWVLRNLESLSRGTRVVILTGFDSSLRHRERLESRGVEILEKGSSKAGDFLEELEQLPAKKATNEILKRSRPHVASPPSESAVSREVREELLKRMSKMFVAWASQLEKGELPVFFAGEQGLSASRMIAEVNQQTELGLALLDLFVEELED
jgi:ActR/RegA family two-component response regulator